MIIYFAGVNQHSFCDAFAGLHVLESFADARELMDRYRPTFASMVLDCGAFSALGGGPPIDLESYVTFCKEHGAGYRWVASLDSIDGGPDANIANWNRMRAAGIDAMPTFHQGEPWDLLALYCAEAKRIGLGFQRPIQRGREWLADCFSRIPPAFPVHGWAMTDYTEYPFESVDSTTWRYELRALQGVAGQGAAALDCLTVRELIEIVQKKYLRLPRRRLWDGTAAKQMALVEAVP